MVPPDTLILEPFGGPGLLSSTGVSFVAVPLPHAPAGVPRSGLLLWPSARYGLLTIPNITGRYLLLFRSCDFCCFCVSVRSRPC